MFFEGFYCHLITSRQLSQRSTGGQEIRRSGVKEVIGTASGNVAPNRPMYLLASWPPGLLISCEIVPRLLRKVLVNRRSLDAPGRPDLLAGELAGVEHYLHVGLGHAEQFRG